jgi:hypothetical protein
MDTKQPPPRQCQFCGVDLDKGSHKLTCPIVVDIAGIPGYLDMPAFLVRRKPTGNVFE